MFVGKYTHGGMVFSIFGCKRQSAQLRLSWGDSIRLGLRILSYND
jgi:hypothetical protein